MSEITDIPAHWEIKKLGEVCAILSGYGFPKNIQGSSSGEFPFYKVGDISKNVKAGYRTLKLCDNYIDAKTLLNLKAKPFPINTIVFAKIGEGLKLNRRAILGIPGIVDNNVVGVKAIENVCDDMFLFNFLTTVKLEDYSKATTVPSVRKSEIEQILFPLPPLPEQQVIVAKIEELLSELDNGKQQLQTALQQLKVYRQSLLKWAFEGKLTNTNLKEGELPGDWKWVRFGEIFYGTPQNGLYKPSKDYGSGTPILRIDGFYSGIITHDYDYKRVRISKEEIQKYQLSINDIVVNRVNSMSHLGKCGLVKYLKEQTVFESNVMKVQIKNDLALPSFIASYLASLRGIKELTKNAKHAVNQASINQTDVANSLIPLPPLEEQQLIVDELESKLTLCDNVEETIKQSLQQAEILRQSILKKAFEGKLV